MNKEMDGQMSLFKIRAWGWEPAVPAGEDENTDEFCDSPNCWCAKPVQFFDLLPHAEDDERW